MAIDWVADVKKYAANADEGVVAGIVKYCGIALASRDGQLVAFSDKAELATVRANFLKKKLGLAGSDAELDAMIAAVGEKLKGVRQKKRVTVYYLLAEMAGKLDTFAKAPAKPKAAAKPKAEAKAAAKPKPEAKPKAAPKAKAAPKPAPEVKALAEAPAAAPAEAPAQPAPAAAPASAPAPAPAPAAIPASTANTGSPVTGPGSNTLLWLVAGLGVLALLWWLLS